MLKIVHKKGVALYMTLFAILLVIILANIILRIMSSQSRLTHHQVSRIQADFAAMAGINLALEKLRVGDANWIPSPDTGTNTITRTLCRGCLAPDIGEPYLPPNIQRVEITIGAEGSGPSGTREVTAKPILLLPTPSP